MAISFHCAVCGHGIQVNDLEAGSSKHCPQCGELLRVPGEQRVATEQRASTVNADGATVSVVTHQPIEVVTASRGPWTIIGWIVLGVLVLGIGLVGLSCLTCVSALSTASDTSGTYAPTYAPTAPSPYGSDQPDSTQAPQPAEQAPPQMLTAEVLKVYGEFGTAKIDVRFINTSEDVLEYWSIAMEVYDESEGYLGNATASVSGLKPGESKIAKFMFFDVDEKDLYSWEAKIDSVRAKGNLWGPEKQYTLDIAAVR